jgi:hypothetical protein
MGNENLPGLGRVILTSQYHHVGDERGGEGREGRELSERAGE